MRRTLISLAMLLSACGNTTSSQATGGVGSNGGTNSTGGTGGHDGPTIGGGSGASGGSTQNGCGDSGGPTVVDSTGLPTTTNWFVAALASTSVGGQGDVKCLPRKLSEDADGRVPCSVVAISPKPCSCEATPGAVTGRANLANAAWAQFQSDADAPGNTCPDWCVCELTQLSGAALTACQSDPAATSPVGFCYVDLAENPASAALVADCPDNQKRLLRFLGGAGPDGTGDSHWFIACSATTLP